MSMFQDFQTFNFEEGVPYISITKNGVTFNKAVIMKLNYPKHVILLINPIAKKIAIQCCSQDTPNSVPFHKEKANNVLSIRWNAKDLLNTLQDIAGWDLSKESYRIDGILFKEVEAMVFDLTTAKELN